MVQAGGPGFTLDDSTVVSSHFGDHPSLQGKTLRIPYEWDDPDPALRREAAAIIREYVHPRSYLLRDVDAFCDEHLRGRTVIGVHMRGTDAASGAEGRGFRWGSLNLKQYRAEVTRLLDAHGDALIFVATDEETSLAYMKRGFGARVRAYDSLRHSGGDPVGQGPTGCILPAYIAGDPDRAAKNGEEAVAEYLTLCCCDHLVHNGSSLARTVLLAVPEMPHTNTHQGARFADRARHFLVHRVPWKVQSFLGRFGASASRIAS